MGGLAFSIHKQGDNVLGSIHASVHPYVQPLMTEPFEESLPVQGVCVSVVRGGCMPIIAAM